MQKLIKKKGIVFCLASEIILVSFIVFDTIYFSVESSLDNLFTRFSVISSSDSIRTLVYPLPLFIIFDRVSLGSSAFTPLVFLKNTVS